MKNDSLRCSRWDEKRERERESRSQARQPASHIEPSVQRPGPIPSFSRPHTIQQKPKYKAKKSIPHPSPDKATLTARSRLEASCVVANFGQPQGIIPPVVVDLVLQLGSLGAAVVQGPLVVVIVNHSRPGEENRPGTGQRVSSHGCRARASGLGVQCAPRSEVRASSGSKTLHGSHCVAIAFMPCMCLPRRMISSSTCKFQPEMYPAQVRTLAACPSGLQMYLPIFNVSTIA